MPLDQHRFERRAKIISVADAHRFDRIKRNHDFCRADRQAGGPKDTREMQNVAGELLAPEQRFRRCHHAGNATASARASATSLAATSGVIAPTSSQYLSSSQRIGHRVRIERCAVQRDQRLGPIERLGDTGRLEGRSRAAAA